MGANSCSKSARTAKLWQFWQGHPKPAFSEKVQKGDQGKFFKNRPKRSRRLKGRKALWLKRQISKQKSVLAVRLRWYETGSAGGV